MIQTNFFEFDLLEQVAKEVIAILMGYPEFANQQILVIGGLAAMKYIGNDRKTKDVNFLVTVPGAPEAVKEELLHMPHSCFRDYAGIFVYNWADHVNIQIDMIPVGQIPYVPDTVREISKLLPDEIPYISMKDLMVLKVFSCSLRLGIDKAKSTVDAKDATTLLGLLKQNGWSGLTTTQLQITKRGLRDLFEAYPICEEQREATIPN